MMRRYHPAVAFVSFGAVIGLSVFLLHPVCLAISLLCAVCEAHVLGCRLRTRTVVAVVLTAACMNGLFSHRGVTVLLYFPTGNPLTAEALYYGLAAGGMLAALLGWCSCLQQVMTSERIMTLMGRVTPYGALLLSMILRFFPQLRAKSDALRMGLDGLRGGEPKTKREQLRRNAAQWGALFRWSMEHSVVTADSMISRGYGLGKRTSFSREIFSLRDGLAVGWMLLLTVCVAVQARCLSYHYDPIPGSAAPWQMQLLPLIAYALLCVTPILIEGWEVIRWRIYRSRR